MIAAPLVAALLRFHLAVGVLGIDAKSDRSAMNDRDDAFVRSELVPIDGIAFERIDGEGDVLVLPGFVEFRRLCEDYEWRADNQQNDQSRILAHHNNYV